MFGILIVIGFRKNLSAEKCARARSFCDCASPGDEGSIVCARSPKKVGVGAGEGGGRGDEKGGEASKYGGSQNLCSENHGCAHQITCYGESSKHFTHAKKRKSGGRT